jgi:hypothetical protein
MQCVLFDHLFGAVGRTGSYGIKAAKVRIASVRMMGISSLRRWLSPHHHPHRATAPPTRRSTTLAPQTYWKLRP